MFKSGYLKEKYYWSKKTLIKEITGILEARGLKDINWEDGAEWRLKTNL